MAAGCPELTLGPYIPVGSINVPRKNGNLISIISSKEKVTSIPREIALLGWLVFSPVLGGTEPGPHAPRSTQEQLTQVEKLPFSETLPDNSQNCIWC